MSRQTRASIDGVEKMISKPRFRPPSADAKFLDHLQHFQIETQEHLHDATVGTQDH